MKIEKRIADFTLLCMYLSSWKEDVEDFPGLKKNNVTQIIRAWKGYSNDDLLKLHIYRDIYLSPKAKSLVLTPDGMKKAIDIDRYGFKEAWTLDERRLALSLLLIYLTAWEEDSHANPGQKIWRVYRGFFLEVIEELINEKMIFIGKNSKYAIFTQKGLEYARYLERELFLKCETAA